MKSRSGQHDHELAHAADTITDSSNCSWTTPPDRETGVHASSVQRRGTDTAILRILDLSKIRAGTLGYEYTDVELNAVMEELEGGFRMQQQPKDSPVDHLPQEISCPLHRTDRKRLIQVIANLLSNAVIHSRRLRRFRIRKPRRGTLRHRRRHGAASPKNTGNSFQRFIKAGSFRQGIGID